MPDDPSSKDPKDNNVLYSAMAIDQTPERSTAEINLDKMIGDRLKQYYATRLSQPLPDKFADLLIPALVDQNLWAQSRSPMDMILHGWSTSLFHASQQWSTISS